MIIPGECSHLGTADRLSLFWACGILGVLSDICGVKSLSTKYQL